MATKRTGDAVRGQARRLAARSGGFDNDVRLLILRALITEGPKSVGELAGICNVSLSGMSQQLVKLQSQGFITSDRDPDKAQTILKTAEMEVIREHLLKVAAFLGVETPDVRVASRAAVLQEAAEALLDNVMVYNGALEVNHGFDGQKLANALWAACGREGTWKQ